MRCMWCGIHRDYYLTAENASRQNCRESDNGYHDFVWFPCIARLFARKPSDPPRYLLERRNRTKARTI